MEKDHLSKFKKLTEEEQLRIINNPVGWLEYIGYFDKLDKKESTDGNNKSSRDQRPLRT